MANEALITSSLFIKKGNLEYQSRPQTFRADILTDAPKGPVPGAIKVTWDGRDVDLSQLGEPGLCRISHLGRADGSTTAADATNYMEYGIREPATNTFYPLGELLPGESYVLRLSRNLQEEYQGTGTGTSGPGNFLHLKSASWDHGELNGLVEAFER